MKKIYVIIAITIVLGAAIFVTWRQGLQINISDSKKYTDELLGFSFAYPVTYSISSFGSPDDNAGETILIQKEGGEKGIQVLITPFDEDIVLTETRIRSDIPDLAITDVYTQKVGTRENAVQTVVFTSINSLMGKSNEAWFVYKGKLYQMSAPVDVHDVFATMLNSWEF
ncbi:MAG: hypothetical protein A2747_02425 [Candidatus Yonathbacteria bacterium RIFCSPHIGHO2_01_FULL_44_41]|uniref:PsbP C-terminal domain-containing protein n=1 Tax=Candidatus Yonathbacteria bacterium RIFCSPHIGHO2_02_FULL_44_14 TaxID=1802724 RepID=A0A1G2S903_9BACT|nr:MAG: hypothetical protein A2747_02425 [Candidatus Yonathbacteria bacterium RIFCSPHIGHO2_01_FULL_44_41]OHA80751.1 MAG: hypothetical protein A3D51_03880 [Candidatus Yonathbacteria bacterium RIFCSPHIGHO2_02_FULL_44_14]OHA82077.1 MAG: hypothetical protein A3B06_01030 [Candidatus Yonathbacteria bacterium RIFCSPLOWO2_01_FULL_43_20]